MKDILTVDYVEQNSGYLKCKNENKVGAGNIAVYCVYIVELNSNINVPTQ